MFTFKQTMRKYLSLLFITISFVSFAQFQENVFEQDKSASGEQKARVETRGNDEQSSSETADSAEDDDDTPPPHPGEEPVPIDGLLPFLFLTGLFFIIYYKGKNKKINI